MGGGDAQLAEVGELDLKTRRLNLRNTVTPSPSLSTFDHIVCRSRSQNYLEGNSSLLLNLNLMPNVILIPSLILIVIAGRR